MFCSYDYTIVCQLLDEFYLFSMEVLPLFCILFFMLPWTPQALRNKLRHRGCNGFDFGVQL
jgi:hypothetical protein